METIKRLEDFEVFQMAQEIGEQVWNTVVTWEHFAKTTIGEQFVDAADSISANIAEGFGRYHFRERRTFCYYSRGSLMETKAWAIKSYKRKLLTPDAYDLLMVKMATFHHKLNGYIQSLSKQIQAGKNAQ